MKNSIKRFFRAFYLTSVIIFCILIGFFGISEAYKNIRLVAFGEYRDAIEINEDGIFIFDYKL
jgi:hypothetical protein